MIDRMPLFFINRTNWLPGCGIEQQHPWGRQFETLRLRVKMKLYRFLECLVVYERSGKGGIRVERWSSRVRDEVDKKPVIVFVGLNPNDVWFGCDETVKANVFALLARNVFTTSFARKRNNKTLNKRHCIVLMFERNSTWRNNDDRTAGLVYELERSYWGVRRLRQRPDEVNVVRAEPEVGHHSFGHCGQRHHRSCVEGWTKLVERSVRSVTWSGCGKEKGLCRVTITAQSLLWRARECQKTYWRTCLQLYK